MRCLGFSVHDFGIISGDSYISSRSVQSKYCAGSTSALKILSSYWPLMQVHAGPLDACRMQNAGTAWEDPCLPMSQLEACLRFREPPHPTKGGSGTGGLTDRGYTVLQPRLTSLHPARNAEPESSWTTSGRGAVQRDGMASDAGR